jgi:hypothetical protein
MAYLWDSYERKAVVAPAIIILLPYAVFQVYFLNVKIDDFEQIFVPLKVLTKISLPFVFLYFVTSLSRLIGKEIFENWFFQDSLHLPTTQFLLYSDKTLSISNKKAIRAKIEAEFPIKLLSEAKEEADELEARRTITDAVGHIRQKLKGGRMILKRNIEYGYWRNLVGGSIIALVFAIINLLLFKYVEPQAAAFWMSAVLTAVYAGLLASSKWAIGRLGKIYAKTLYEEYLVAHPVASTE